MNQYVATSNVGFKPMVEITEPGSERTNLSGKVIHANTILCTFDEAIIIHRQLGELLSNVQQPKGDS